MHRALTLYFDGECALCRSEVQRLRRWDRHGSLAFVDIAQADFSPASLGVDIAALRALIHSRTSDGRMLAGIDSIVAAYTLVGRGWMVWPLRVALLRRFWSAFYRFIARNRYRLSHLAAHRAVCTGDVCRREFF
jgi:predicted DCC family thiol-disulfide oxidoreductase YuxK